MMDYSNLSRSDLVRLLKKITEVLEETNSRTSHFLEYSVGGNKIYSPKTKSQLKNNLQSLIGTIPFLLLDNRIFEKNQDIAAFASRLDIHIPSPDKKKREDIIGRVVSGISKFDPQRLYELNRIINQMQRSAERGNKNTFFRDWDIAIKNMKI